LGTCRLQNTPLDLIATFAQFFPDLQIPEQLGNCSGLDERLASSARRLATASS